MLDSVSRKSFERSFPKTISFLESISQFGESEDQQSVEFYQFFNHKVVGHNTYPNTLGLMNGAIRPRQIPIFEKARRKGYVTSLSDNLCNEWSMMYNYVNDDKVSFSSDNNTYICDYVHLEPFCDLSYTSLQTHFDTWKGSSSSSRRCLFQKDAFDYVFDYSLEIEKLYSDVSKWMYLGFMDGHEGTGEVINFVDEGLFRYVKNLNEFKVLEKSVIFIVGDHGNTINFIQNSFKEGNVESWHPVLNVVLPKDYLSDSERKNIKINQHRITTHFDIHKTMLDIIGETNDNVNIHGLGLWMEKIPYDRNCTIAGIPENHICGIVCE